MAKRRKRRKADDESAASNDAVEDYTDAEGNVLTLRTSLSGATIAKLNRPPRRAAATQEDVWRRRSEMMFERLAVSWEIAGLPLDDQKMLLGRYRMADSDTQRWVRETIDAHVRRHIPELAGD